MAQYQDGKTFINRQTGQRLIMQGGVFKPIGVTGVMSDTGTDQQALEAARAKARISLDTATQADRFMDINREQPTGGWRNMPATIVPLPFVDEPKMGDLAAAFTGNPKRAEMKSISATVAPGMRPPGSGSSSDKDTKLYLQGFPSVDNLGPANTQIAGRLRDQSDRENAVSAFKDTWYARNGTLLGADKAFNTWWSSREPKPKMQGPSPSAPRLDKPGARVRYDASGNEVP